MGATALLMSQIKYNHTHTNIMATHVFPTHMLIHQIKLLLLISPHSHQMANSVAATKELGKLLNGSD
jgi:hypothetical protein